MVKFQLLEGCQRPNNTRTPMCWRQLQPQIAELQGGKADKLCLGELTESANCPCLSCKLHAADVLALLVEYSCTLSNCC